MEFHKGSMEFPCSFIKFRGVSMEFHGDSMEVSWRFHGGSMVFPWSFHGVP